MYRQMLQNIIIILLVGIYSAGCVKDKPDPQNQKMPPKQDAQQKVLMVCEGSMGSGNGELNVYLPNRDSIFHNVFYNTHGRPLGDVFQSVQRFGDAYFLCINNSDKIVILDKNTWQEKSQIKVPKPRYLLDIGNDKAYVGSLFHNKIHVINTKNLSIERSIDMPYENIEGMALYNGRVYVCCWDTACNKIFILNPQNHTIEDSIEIHGKAPQSIVVDKKKQLWIMSGNTYKGKNAHLSVINPDNKSMLKDFDFESGIEAIKPCFNVTKDSLFFLEVDYNGGTKNNGLFVMSINDNYLPKTPFIAAQPNQYFWALGIHPNNGTIYLGDPKGFIQMGAVYIYNSLGQKQKEFSVGLGIGSFYFD